MQVAPVLGRERVEGRQLRPVAVELGDGLGYLASNSERKRSRAARASRPELEEASCRSCCWMPPVVVVHRRRCLVSRWPSAAKQGAALSGRPAHIEEIVAVMRHADHGMHGRRLRGLIVVLWRAGLRTHEAQAGTAL
jgi:hypothetical protein